MPMRNKLVDRLIVVHHNEHTYTRANDRTPSWNDAGLLTGRALGFMMADIPSMKSMCRDLTLIPSLFCGTNTLAPLVVFNKQLHNLGLLLGELRVHMTLQHIQVCLQRLLVTHFHKRNELGKGVFSSSGAVSRYTVHDPTLRLCCAPPNDTPSSQQSASLYIH